MNIKYIFWHLMFIFPPLTLAMEVSGEQQLRRTIRADAAIFDEEEKKLPSAPPLSHTKLSFATLNKYGFDVTDSTTIKESWLINKLMKSAKNAKRPLLDVGGGYGGITGLLLSKGATVIYNDIEEKHLLLGRKTFPCHTYSRLYLNSQVFPNEMEFAKESLDGVILHRVLHFMEGEKIEEGLKKAFQWLAPKGKIFIVVLAPQHPGYKDKILESYEKMWEQGNPWPGYGLKAEEALPSQAYNLPEVLHVMDDRPLERALHKANFTVIRKGFISMQQFGDNTERNGQEAYGIIASKDIIK